jgi:hypothetical protein
MTGDPRIASWDSPAAFEHVEDLKALHGTAVEGDVWLAKAIGLRDSSLIIYERLGVDRRRSSGSTCQS